MAETPGQTNRFRGGLPDPGARSGRVVTVGAHLARHRSPTLRRAGPHIAPAPHRAATRSGFPAADSAPGTRAFLLRLAHRSSRRDPVIPWRPLIRAVQITRFGGPEVLDVVDLPDPVLGDGEQRFTISSSGVNVSDTHRR